MQVISAAALVLPVIWFATTVWVEADRMETEARARMMKVCVPEAGQSQCELWLEANHEPCYRTSHHGGGRASRAYVDHGEYQFCVEHGIEGLRERRREDRRQNPY